MDASSMEDQDSDGVANQLPSQILPVGRRVTIGLIPENNAQ
jgi:hypothetical protein